MTLVALIALAFVAAIILLLWAICATEDREIERRDECHKKRDE